MKLAHFIPAAALLAASTSALPAAEGVYVDADTVRQAQRILGERGFRTGVDGLMGPRTQAALKRFQRAQNLEPSGQLNRQTLVALGLRESASGGSSAPQYGREVVRSVEQTLNARGFRAGPADGTVTAQTRAALKEFQKSENLQDTGQLNPGTLAALGVPADEEEQPASLVLSSAKVRALQAKLIERGFNVGPVDGRMGAATRAALRDFQRSQDLPVTGRIDSRTLAALGVADPLASRN